MEQKMMEPNKLDNVQGIVDELKGNAKQPQLYLEQLAEIPENLKEKVVVVFIRSKNNDQTREYDHTMTTQNFDANAWKKSIEKNIVRIGKGEMHILHDGIQSADERIEKERAERIRIRKNAKSKAESDYKKREEEGATRALESKKEAKKNEPDFFEVKKTAIELGMPKTVKSKNDVMAWVKEFNAKESKEVEEVEEVKDKD